MTLFHRIQNPKRKLNINKILSKSLDKGKKAINEKEIVKNCKTEEILSIGTK